MKLMWTMIALSLLMGITTLVLRSGLFSQGEQPYGTAEAAMVEYFSTTSDTTYRPDNYVGFISIEAVTANVRAVISGGRFSSGEDTLTILSGDILNVNLYESGGSTREFSVFPAATATARGYYW